MQLLIQFLLNRKIVHTIAILTTIFFIMVSTEGLLNASAQEISPGESTNATVDLSIRNNKKLFSSAEDITLQVAITNSNNQPIKILKWLTPFEGVQGPLFNVLRDGVPVAYLGPIYKHVAPTEQDYITLAAGETLTAEVNLSPYYDLSASGNYEISYDVISVQLYLEDNPARKTPYKTGRLTSDTVGMFIEKHAKSAPPEVETQAVVGYSGFYGCSASRQAELLTARSSASSYANGAVSYFAANNNGSRYTTWFGAYNISRYNTVSSHFSAIRNAIDSVSMTFDCTCTDPSVYAYVYPYSPYAIYLCGAFWIAPTTGSDSKAGVLIHETSHFKVLAGTYDYAYGQGASQSLAASNPAAAIINADNYEYFAENSPAIVEPGTGLFNSDFESGKTGWVEYSSNGFSLIDVWHDGSGYPPIAHSGTWYTWLGGDLSETSIISQSVNISAYTPYLRLWYIINSNESCGKDYGYIRLNSATVHTWNLCNANSSANWQELTLNLRSYVGQTISLQISAVTTPSTKSDLFVDDATLYGTFADVPSTHWAWNYIERLYNAGITGGCGSSPLVYCPEGAVSRAQMAVFLEKGIHGSSFSPANIAPTFNDTVGHWAEDWIEALKSDGITSGCGTNFYCPNTNVTRAQMAVFLLKSKHGASYSPPPATGTMFGDVPASHWAAAWIERLAAEGITGGCGGINYCPDSQVTRAQMAVFLVKTFNLP